MMKIGMLVFVLLLSLSLAACISVSSRKLTPNLYVVSAQAGSSFSEADTEAEVFKKAAEITLETGNRWFCLESDKTYTPFNKPRSTIRIRLYKEKPQCQAYDAAMIAKAP